MTAPTFIVKKGSRIGKGATFLGKPQKCSLLSGPTTKALTVTPLELSGLHFFGTFLELKKK